MVQSAGYKSIKRQTAFRAWIAQLHNGNYVKKDGWESNYVEVNGKKISRVNILATVVAKFSADDNNYASITLDDFSSTIRAKCWGEDTRIINGINLGDVVIIVGKIREYNEERYLTPDFIKKIDDPNWEIVRKLELFKEYGKLGVTNGVKKEIFEKKLINGNERNRQKIYGLIEKLDVDDNGAKIDDIIRESKLDGEEIEGILNELLKEGEVFQPKPSRFKIV